MGREGTRRVKYELFDYQESAKVSVVRALMGMARAHEEDTVIKAQSY